MKREMKQEDLGAPPAQSTLIIDRKRWLRGEDMGTSRLLRVADGKLCCLGFFALACGYTEEDILDAHIPTDVADGGLWPDWLWPDPTRPYSRVSAACWTLVKTNDDSHLSEPERERRLTDEFAKHGVDVDFTGDAPKAPEKSP